MKTIKRYILAVTLIAQAVTMMAQELNSAYFVDDYKYRHIMNPALANEQSYVAIPVLGNLNMRLQGSLGVGDFFFKNPDYGIKSGAKKTTTFMHPGISVDEALSGFDKGANTVLFDMDLPVVSVGFAGFDGYNTIELKERMHFGLSMPYDFFKFATERGMVGIKGHRLVGGFRASCYNAMDLEGVQALVDCIHEYEKLH